MTLPVVEVRHVICRTPPNLRVLFDARRRRIQNKQAAIRLRMQVMPCATLKYEPITDNFIPPAASGESVARMQDNGRQYESNPHEMRFPLIFSPCQRSAGKLPVVWKSPLLKREPSEMAVESYGDAMLFAARKEFSV